MRTFSFILALIGLSLSATAQDKAIHYKELQKYLPQEIMGYSASGEIDGSSFEMNGMSYSTAIQDYEKGESRITISIIDYHAAVTLYTAATMAWSMGMSFEDDEQKAGGVEIDGFKGWQVYQKEKEATELVMGVKDRYLVTIDASASTDVVKSIFSKLNLGKLPD